jgi:hypothetical protein
LKKIYTYQAFGLTISSEIEIPEFIQTTGKSQVRISLGKVPVNISHVYKQGFRYQISKNEFLLRFKTWAQFYVEDGKNITIQSKAGVDERDIRAFILSPVIGALLHQRGMLPLHASGICYNNCAVLFAGNSGAGKSTLALAMCRNYGLKLISDDITSVSTQNDECFVNSSFPFVKLWQDSVEMFDMSIEDLPKIRNNVLKYKYDNSKYFIAGNFIPTNLFFIECADVKEVVILEIKGSEKFNLLRKNIFRINMVEGLYSSSHFSVSLALLNSVKCYKLLRSKKESLPNKLAGEVYSVLQKTTGK